MPLVSCHWKPTSLGLLGLLAILFIKLVEQPENQSSELEEDRPGKVSPSLFAHPSRSISMATTARMKRMEYTAMHCSRAGWSMYREVLLMKTKITQATKVSSILQ